MKIWIETRIAKAIAKAAATQAPREMGGVLAGWQHDETVVICFATVGGENDLATSCSYTPDHDWQERELAKAYAASEGDLTYLGDWHSHPCGPLALSVTDQQTLREIAKVRPDGCMLLCAKSGEDWLLAAWQVRKTFIGSRRIHGSQITTFDAPADWPVIVTQAF